MYISNYENGQDPSFTSNDNLDMFCRLVENTREGNHTYVVITKG